VFRLLPVLLLCLPLGGCATLAALGTAAEVRDVYELQVPAVAPQQGRLRGEIVVEEPVASGALNTDRIMIRPGPLQAQYLPEARWADPAPRMLQTLLLRSLAETGAFRSVGRRPVGSLGDYAVLTELTDFEAIASDAATGGPAVRVRVMVRLVRERDASVVARQTFSAAAPAAGTDVTALVSAFDEATQGLLTELVAWLVART